MILRRNQSHEQDIPPYEVFHFFHIYHVNEHEESEKHDTYFKTTNGISTFCLSEMIKAGIYIRKSLIS